MTKKYLLLLTIILSLPLIVRSQSHLADSLRTVLANATSDSVRCGVTMALYTHFEELNRDSAYHYAGLGLQLTRANNKKLNEVTFLCSQAYQEVLLGHFAASLQSLLAAFTIAENPASEKYYWKFDPLPPHQRRLAGLGFTHHIFAILMNRTQNTEAEIFHFKAAKKIAEDLNNSHRILTANMNLGRAYTKLMRFDSALIFEQLAEDLAKRTGNKYLAFILYQEGVIYLETHDTTKAVTCFHYSIQTAKDLINLSAMARSYHEMTKIEIARKDKDSSLYYAKKNFETLTSLGSMVGTDVNIATSYENLYRVYALRKQFDSAFKYQGRALVTQDSLYKIRIQNLADFQNLTFREQLRLQELEKEKVVYQSRIRTYFMLAGIGVLLLLATTFFINNRQKHKANLKIEKAYGELQATQAQLIQSEKMASLGELTAGIAHEIQNPLNFVNNFSEVNTELIDELAQEAAKGNLEEVKNLAKDIKDNEEKINHHGKRADAIVKGMLQHSRSSSGVKEPTDINALADEYFRLAYHGLRAKDKSFNATMTTDFDSSIGTVNVIPQDIGRVVLNLITNAFYAVTEKKSLAPSNYEPTVVLSTKKSGGKVLIRVKDNGSGIPQNVVDKIFQPFFTTKPTGQGTGLGLSLSYDIVKAHGGELKVETTAGEGSEFVIGLPI